MISMQTSPGGTIMIELPDGSMGDICDPKICLQYFHGLGKKRPMKQFLGILKKCKPKDATKDIAVDKFVLLYIFGGISIALERCLTTSRGELEISNEDYEAVFKFFCCALKDIYDGKAWVSTGALNIYQTEILNNLQYWCCLPSFCKLMFQQRGYKTVSTLLQRSKGFPCQPASNACLNIINNSLIATMEMHYTEAVALDMVHLQAEALFKLEKSGLIAQGLRALTVPLHDQADLPAVLQFVNAIMRDSDLMQKRLVASKPTGDILLGILNGKDGWKGSNPSRNEAMTRLFKLKDAIASPELPLGSCHRCYKGAAFDLKKCSQCKNVMYCGRECQRADWEHHKKFCKKFMQLRNSRTKGEVMPMSMVVRHFISDRYMDIMQEIRQVTEKLGVSMREVVLVVDVRNEHNSNFCIKPYKSVMAGKELLNWDFGANERVGIESRYERLVDGIILLMHRSFDCDFEVAGIGAPNSPLFSDAVLAQFPLDDF